MRSAAVTEQALQYLVEKGGQGKLCPVLGAGSGIDSGGPNWQTLIEDLYSRSGIQLEKDQKEGGEKDQKEGGKSDRLSSDPVHLYDLLRFDEALPDRLSDVLYGDKWSAPRTERYRKRNEGNWPELGKPANRISVKPEPANKVLALLAVIIASESPRREFHTITYNLDTHLERQIAELGHRPAVVVEDQELGPIELRWKSDLEGAPKVRFGVHGRPTSVRVFHPHGVIFKKEDTVSVRRLQSASEYLAGRMPRPRPDLEREVDRRWKDSKRARHHGVVLGRIDYNQLFGSLNDPRNLRQLAAFSRLACLFYGLSFQDPNVDRLLEVGVTLVRSSIELPEEGENLPRHVALRYAEDAQLNRPLVKDWKVKDEVDFREERRMLNRGVLRVGHDGFEQHRRFVIELVRRLSQELGYGWIEEDF